MPARDRTKRRVAPKQQRAQASVEAILTATGQLLAEQGFVRTTTNHIAERAGVNVALVYRYFAGKEAIVGALIDRASELTRDAMGAVVARMAEESLPELLRALVTASVQTPGLETALHRELTQQVFGTKRGDTLRALRAELAQLFAHVIEQRRQELRPDLDLDAMRFVLQHATEAASHAVAFERPEGLSAARAIDALTEVLVRALCPTQDL